MYYFMQMYMPFICVELINIFFFDNFMLYLTSKLNGKAEERDDTS